MDRFEARLGSILAAWVGGVCRRPAVTIALVVLGAVGAALYSAGNLGIKGDTEALFSADLPYKQAERIFYDAFPTQFENMFIVLDGVTPERAGEAAADLAARLREERDDFRMVFQPGGGAFFEQNAFLYLDTEELADLADQLAQAQPYLAELSRDGSIRGLASILFALFVLGETNVPAADHIVAIVIAVVGASIVVHGLSAAPAASRYGQAMSAAGDSEEMRDVSSMPARGGNPV